MKKLDPKIYDNNGNHYYTFVATDTGGNNYFVYLNPNDNNYYLTQLGNALTGSLPDNAVQIAKDADYGGNKYDIYWYLDNNNQPHIIAKDQNGTLYDVVMDTTNKLTNYQTIEAAAVDDYWESFILLKSGDNQVYDIIDTANSKVINNPTGGVDKEGQYNYAILKFKDGKIQDEYSRIALSLQLLPPNLQEKLQLSTVNLEGLTQYPVDFSLGFNQDGYEAGRFTSLSIGENGVVTALYSNGVSKDIARLQLAYFKDKQALSPKGENLYATFSTIQPIIENAGVASKIRSGTLELSNVDIAQEMINMITAEKAYQANAKVIQTGQTIMDTTINLKR
jgi:flagellar hook-basal body protein